MGTTPKSPSHAVAYIAVLLFIISLIVYLNIVFQQNLNKDIAKQFNDQQLLLARGAALNIENHVDNYEKHLLTISHLPVVRDMADSAARDQVLEAVLFDIPQDPAKVVNFQLVDKDGVVRLDRSSGAVAGMDISKREYFRAASKLISGEVHISGMLNLPELNPAKRYIVIATPLFRSGASPGGLNGVALFAVSVDDIAGEYVSQIRLGERGYAWVMDSHGTLVYHPSNPEMIGRNLLEADDSCFSCHRSFDAEKRILTGSESMYGVYTAPMGEDKLISFSRARVGSESWIVCVTVPYTEVTALIERSMKLYSWLISIIFFTVIGASVYFLVLIKKKTMADERAKYAAELEDKVNERTWELSREKEKLKAILSGLGAGVALLDREMKVMWVNDVITANVGDTAGRRCYEAYMGREVPCEGCPLPAALASGRLEHTEMVCRNPATRKRLQEDGGPAHLLARLSREDAGYFQVAIAPIKNASGEIDHVVELVQDVTEVRRLKEQMMHSEKLAALGRVSAGIAHEIGNPLTSIYSFIQILQSNKYDEFTNKTLDTISFHINRIKHIVQQMSGLASKHVVTKGLVDVNDSVGAALDLLGHEKGLKDCELDTSFHMGRLVVKADENWLVSVFVNLIINALDAMPDGGRLSVRTRVEEQGEDRRAAVVEVSDTGIGIPPEDVERIFDPFFTTKQSGKGTGLGLAVSYGVVKDFGGSISVASVPGEGATFTVRVPMEG
jgi:C4-dicarboxylate-specific signal transduction histidine kinase